MKEDIFFADLETSAAFRADMLYFLKLVGNYMANIFITVRAGAPSKHRKAFAEWAGQTPPYIQDKQLRDAIQKKQAWFEAYKTDFSAMLDNMPLAMRDRLARSIQNDHCLPLSLPNFVKMLDNLREYRHWLNHYDEKIEKNQKRPITDAAIARHLGLLLLPHLHNHLLGRIHHHRCKAGHRHFGRPKANTNGPLLSIFADAVADRKEATMERMGKRTKGRIIRKERQEAQQAGERWRKTHAARFAPETWPRYNLYNWKTRFYFMGEGRIAQLENRLRMPGVPTAPIDFMHGVEPLFDLSIDINLTIHLTLEQLKEAGVKIGNKQAVGPIIPALRNEIAHGGFFWDVKVDGQSLSVASIFEAVQELLLKQLGGKQMRNDFVTATEHHLRRSRAILAYPPNPSDDPNQHPPPIRIRNWSSSNRNRYGKGSGYRLERRGDLRRVAAAWMRELQQAREKIDSEVKI